MLIHTEQKHAGLLCHTCLVFGSISASHLDNSCFIFPSGKKKKPNQTQHCSVPYQQMSNEKWFINAHCSAPALRVKGSPETQTSLFLSVRN